MTYVDVDGEEWSHLANKQRLDMYYWACFQNSVFFYPIYAMSKEAGQIVVADVG